MTGRSWRAAAAGSATARLAHSSAAVYRSLASRPGARLAPDPAGIDRAGWQMLLAEMPRRVQPRAIARWRGRIDALAVRERYSDAREFARQRPATAAAQRLFALLEQARVEALGARAFVGVRVNLEALAQERWVRARPEGVVRAAGEAWVETFALLARVPLGAPLPLAAHHSLDTGWRQWLTTAQAGALERLGELIGHQRAFGAQALDVIALLAPPSEPATPPHPPAEPNGEQGAEAQASAPPGDAQRPLASGDPLAWHEAHAAPQGVPVARASRAATPPYQVYSTRFDEVVRAAELSDARTLQQRREELDRRVGPHLAAVMRGAHRLQRRLLALQMRSWQFDLEEGVLDASRLSRVVTHPLEPLAYKQETQIEFPDTIVSILVDNSGSMRGTPIATAAVCAELLGRVLERCGVESEVLGFTTRSWRGGRARAQWVAAGRPAHPGRLTELRHIVYKAAGEPWRRARPAVGLMLDEDLLKENVDGEALLWAYGRLMQRPEPRRILLVISDGAPLDEATLEANDLEYLDRHLRRTIQWLERDGQVQLAAIGIGHDVTGYYHRAMTLRGADQLGEAMVAQLSELLEPPRPSRRVPTTRTVTEEEPR